MHESLSCPNTDLTELRPPVMGQWALHATQLALASQNLQKKPEAGLLAADLAQLGAESAHLGGALRGVARALGVSQHIEAARQDVAVALQLRLGELQGQARLPLGPHRHPQLLPAACQRPLLQQLLRQVRLHGSSKVPQPPLPDSREAFGQQPRCFPMKFKQG